MCVYWNVVFNEEFDGWCELYVVFEFDYLCVGLYYVYGVVEGLFWCVICVKW